MAFDGRCKQKGLLLDGNVWESYPNKGTRLLPTSPFLTHFDPSEEAPRASRTAMKPIQRNLLSVAPAFRATFIEDFFPDATGVAYANCRGCQSVYQTVRPACLPGAHLVETRTNAPPSTEVEITNGNTQKLPTYGLLNTNSYNKFLSFNLKTNPLYDHTSTYGGLM